MLLPCGSHLPGEDDRGATVRETDGVVSDRYWRCNATCCPVRRPKPADKAPQCYTCGRVMAPVDAFAEILGDVQSDDSHARYLAMTPGVCDAAGIPAPDTVWSGYSSAEDIRAELLKAGWKVAW